MFYVVGGTSEATVNSTALMVANANDAAAAFEAAVAWDESSGFGTVYGPASPLSSSAATGVTWLRQGTAAVFSVKSSPYVCGYAWSSGWGSKYSDPGSPPLGGYPNGIDLSKSGAEFFMSGTGTPYICAVAFNPSTGYGSQYSDPATLPSAAVQRLSVNQAGTYVVAGVNASPYIIAYAWTGSGWGSKLSDPATYPTENPVGANFCPNGSKVVLYGGSPTYYAYAYNFSDGFGSKYADQASLPTRSPQEARMSKSRGAILSAQIAAGAGQNAAQAWHWTDVGGWGSKYADAATHPDQNSYSVMISGSGANALIGKHNTASYACVIAYAWTDSSGWGTKWTDMSPKSSFDGTGWQCHWNGTGSW